MFNENDKVSAPSLVTIFDTTKTERQTFIEDIVNRIQSGEADPIKVHIGFKCLVEIFDNLSKPDPKKKKMYPFAKAYTSILQEEVAKYGQKEVELYNAKMRIGETGIKPDFSKCNDRVYFDLEDKVNYYKAALDERKEFLKTVPAEGLEIRDGDEMVTIYPPSKTSTTTVITTLI